MDFITSWDLNVSRLAGNETDYMASEGIDCQHSEWLGPE